MDTRQLSEFESFYDRSSDGLYRHILFKTGNSDVASDIAQESYVRVHTRWETYESDEHRIRALYTIARNLITDYYRRRSRIIPVDINACDLASDADTSDELAHKQRNIEQLIEMLQQLPDTDRAIIIGHSINDLSYSELSRQLHKPEPTIRKIHSRALQKVKQLFQSKYGINYLPY